MRPATIVAPALALALLTSCSSQPAGPTLAESYQLADADLGLTVDEARYDELAHRWCDNLAADDDVAEYMVAISKDDGTYENSARLQLYMTEYACPDLMGAYDQLHP